nr:MAG: RNA-dependent RNA polymerase [North shore virus]
MYRYTRRREMDRSTNNSLIYLTQVRPHLITREPRLIDPWVRAALDDTLGADSVYEFGEYSSSFYSMEGHYHNLRLYDRVITPKPKLPLLEEVIAETRKAFEINDKVISLSRDDLASAPFIRTSSAGWSYIGKSKDNHATAIRRAVGTLKTWYKDKHQARGTPSMFRYTPDMAWTRTQLASIDAPKVRPVWGRAFHNINLEGLSAVPLIRYYQEVGYPMVVGVHLYKSLPYIINSVLLDGENKKTGIGLDMSSFDTCPMSWLINEAFDICKDNLIFRDEWEERAFEYSRQYFIETPVIMPDSKMWLKLLGVPSGSYFTQLIDSITNHVLVSYIQLNEWGQTFETFVLGDDSLFGIPIEFGYSDLDAIARHARELGFTQSTHKCIVTGNLQELEFLGQS